MQLEKLIYNSLEEGFESSVTVAGEPIHLLLSGYKENQLDEAGAAAESSKDWIINNLEQVRGYAASKLVDRKNGEWQGIDQKSFTVAEIEMALLLKGMAVYAAGMMELYFDVHDLFFGHQVIVSINEDRIFEGADLAG